MTLKLLLWAGGLLALAAAGAAARLAKTRSSSAQITTEQLSGDWLAQARGKEEHQW